MADTKNKKVLIVDDDRFLLNMYSIKFKKSGFDVDTASSGADALNKLRGDSVPDIILLDLVMPVMDGCELLQNIRKEKLVPNATVIILSNQNQASDIDRAKGLGVAGYIVKASSIPSEVVAEVIKVVNAGKPTV
ncbi:MAG: response regulator [Patescibacteria group bacterium]